MHQLIAIANNIFTAFDASPSFEIRSIFLGLSKDFHRVWHKDLLYKLKNNGRDCTILSLAESFLHNRYTRDVLIVQSLKYGLPIASTTISRNPCIVLSFYVSYGR